MRTILAAATLFALAAPAAAQTARDGDGALPGTQVQSPLDAVNDASILPPSEADALGRPENRLLESLGGLDGTSTGSVGRRSTDIINEAGTTPSPEIPAGQGGVAQGSGSGLPITRDGATSGPRVPSGTGPAAGGNSAF